MAETTAATAPSRPCSAAASSQRSGSSGSFAAPGTAAAQDIQNFKPAGGTWNYFSVEGARVIRHEHVIVPSLVINYGHNPLVTRKGGEVDDTVVGIEEGLNAGMWTVGVVMTGNEMGLQKSDLDALDPKVRELLAARAHARMEKAGAHYVIDGVADLMPCLEDIESRMTRGEHP